MTNSLASLSVAQLKRAVELKEKIEALNQELDSILGAPAAKSPAAKAAKKGGMSAAGRARVAAAQKARWAKIKRAVKTPTTQPAVVAKPAAKSAVAPVAKPAKKKPVISAAGIARIKAAQKARWAKIKGATKK